MKVSNREHDRIERSEKLTSVSQALQQKKSKKEYKAKSDGTDQQFRLCIAERNPNEKK